MDRFEQAKTIDLCQNPLTVRRPPSSSPFHSRTFLAFCVCVKQKEPKLVRARQIPEWSAYDGEIARFARRLAREGKISSTALSEEVDELATVGGKKGKDVEVPKVGLGVVREGDREQVVVNADGKPTRIEL